jgi:hypothetical protein
MPCGDELHIPVRPHASGLWMGIYVIVGGRDTLLMVLDTGSPASVISPNSAQVLQAGGLLVATQTPGHFQLSNMRVRDAKDQPLLPDISVRILPRLTRLQIDGLLGLDFFRHFERVCFQISAMRLELTYPGG